MASHSSPGSICPVRSGWTSSTRCRGRECRLFNSVWDLGSALSHHSLVRKQFSIYPKCSSLTIAGQRSCSSSSWETWPRNQQRKSCRSTTYKVRMPSNKWDKKKTIVCASQTTFLFLLSGSVFRLTESRLNKSNRASDWFWQNEKQLSHYHKEGSEYNCFFDPIYRHTVTVNRTNRSGRRHNFSFASCSFPRCDQMKDFCFWWSPEVVKCAGRFFLHLKKGKLWKNKHVVPWKDWSLL